MPTSQVKERNVHDGIDSQKNESDGNLFILNMSSEAGTNDESDHEVSHGQD
jgi:hypothetical protein